MTGQWLSNKKENRQKSLSFCHILDLYCVNHVSRVNLLFVIPRDKLLHSHLDIHNNILFQWIWHICHKINESHIFYPRHQCIIIHWVILLSAILSAMMCQMIHSPDKLNRHLCRIQSMYPINLLSANPYHILHKSIPHPGINPIDTDLYTALFIADYVYSTSGTPVFFYWPAQKKKMVKTAFQ